MNYTIWANDRQLILDALNRQRYDLRRQAAGRSLTGERHASLRHYHREGARVAADMGGCRIEFKQIDDRADRAFCALTNRWHAGAVDDGGGLSVAWLWVSPRWLLAPLLCPYGPLTATQESSTAATASIKVTAWVTVVPFDRACSAAIFLEIL